jgi:hypothetical protein
MRNVRCWHICLLLRCFEDARWHHLDSHMNHVTSLNRNQSLFAPQVVVVRYFVWWHDRLGLDRWRNCLNGRGARCSQPLGYVSSHVHVHRDPHVRRPHEFVNLFNPGPPLALSSWMRSTTPWVGSLTRWLTLANTKEVGKRGHECETIYSFISVSHIHW